MSIRYQLLWSDLRYTKLAFWYILKRFQTTRDNIQTSYNGTLRVRYAGVGYTYNKELDAFLTPRPFLSWLLNEEKYAWEPPVDMPEDGNRYVWNEVIMEWQQPEEEVGK